MRLSDSNESLRTENDKLSEALVEMKHMNDSNIKENITYGVIGVLGGALATALILGMK